MTLEIYEKGLGHHMYEKMAWESIPLKEDISTFGERICIRIFTDDLLINMEYSYGQVLNA